MSMLFKYMANPYSLFNDGYIRATQLSALNDPFEGTYCKNSLNKLSDHFDYSTEIVPGIGEISFSEYVDKNIHKIGVISLSESKDNLLMWAHYANEHKGVAIGFYNAKNIGMFDSLHVPSSLTITSHKECQPYKGIPSHVIYRKQLRYRLDMFDYDYSNISIEGADRILYEILSQKSDEWIYEKEHRIILRLEQADMVKVKDINKVRNKHVLNLIINSSCYKKNETGDNNYHVIMLNEVHDTCLREVFARELAELSTNPANLYLFKLHKNSISCCLLGVNYDKSILNQIKNGNYRSSFFELWKARTDKKYYTLQFRLI